MYSMNREWICSWNPWELKLSAWVEASSYGRKAVEVRRMLVEPKTRADDAGQAPLDPIVNASSPSAEDAVTNGIRC